MEIKKDSKAGVYKLPNVDRIQGIQLSKAESPQKSKVVLQYTDHQVLLRRFCHRFSFHPSK
jgi:hypothetical protein